MNYTQPTVSSAVVIEPFSCGTTFTCTASNFTCGTYDCAKGGTKQFTCPSGW